METNTGAWAHGVIAYLDYRRGGRRGREKEEEISRTRGMAQAELLLKLCKPGLSGTE